MKCLSVPPIQKNSDACLRFAVIHDAIRDKDKVALGRVVLTNREHPVMIEPFDKGLLAVTLRYPYEVRDAKAYFEDIPGLKLPDEMKQLAAHIVDTKTSHFDPQKLEDRYEAALIRLLRAKQKGKAIKEPERCTAAKPLDQSYGCSAGNHRAGEGRNEDGAEA